MKNNISVQLREKNIANTGEIPLLQKFRDCSQSLRESGEGLGATLGGGMGQGRVGELLVFPLASLRTTHFILFCMFSTNLYVE